MNSMHVLNGDSLLHSFQATGLAGEIVVWREGFSEGPLKVVIDTEFWILRQNWLEKEYGIRLPDNLGYYHMVVAEFEKLSRYDAYDEVVFWFEHDLFCQINLIFLLASFAHKQVGKTRLRLVCIGEFDGVKPFKGLGQLTGTQLAKLYPMGVTLTAQDLTTAEMAWRLVASTDREGLIQFLQQEVGQLSFLKHALAAHIARLHKNMFGLDLIDNRLIQLVADRQQTIGDLTVTWLAEDTIFGCGDWTIENRIDRLINQGFLMRKESILSLAPDMIRPTDTRFIELTQSPGNNIH
jgi:hypothetical protein